MNARDLVLVAILLAIGTVLYAFVPNIANATPDFVYVFAVLAILLVRPKFVPALGLGIVAGILGMAFSKSSAPWVNLPTHPLGVLAATWYITYTEDGPRFKWLKPVVGCAIYGFLSGGIAITVFWQLLQLPIQAYLFGMWPLVIVTTAIAAVINVILYPPALDFYQRYTQGSSPA